MLRQRSFASPVKLSCHNVAGAFVHVRAFPASVAYHLQVQMWLWILYQLVAIEAVGGVPSVVISPRGRRSKQVRAGLSGGLPLRSPRLLAGLHRWAQILIDNSQVCCILGAFQGTCGVLYSV